MVRFEGARTARADCGHRVARDGGDPRAETAEHVDAGDRLEVPELVSDVRHAVVVEDEPGLELRLRLGQLGVRDPVARRQVQLADERALRRRRAACRRSPSTDMMYTNGCSVGSSEPVTDDAMRFSTSERYSRALRCGGGSLKLDHRFRP